MTSAGGTQHIVLGANGHVGSAVVDTLIDAGETVTAVVHSPAGAERWRARGVDAVAIDIADADALRAVFRRGRRAFLLNPPAPPATDTDAEERRTAESIVAALAGSGLEKVVAQSTYGAQPGERCGDLTVLYKFERALAAQAVPVTVLRAAYYFSNWDPLLAAAREGTLPSMLPADLRLPMVAPADLGVAAARFLREPVAATGLHHVEGPARYTPGDVAAAFGRVLGRPVAVAVTPREQWETAFRRQGFSAAAATSYARMIAISVDGEVTTPPSPQRGTTTLDEYVGALVARSSAPR